jgi:hypothetical protein
MSRHWAVAATITASLLTAGPALAQTSQTVTATGTGQTRVHPKNRHSNASIAAAYDRARKAAIGGALKEAREYATDYAQAVGMTLGSVISVSDAQTNGGFYGPGPGPGFFGPFGPGKFCGTLHQPIFQGVPPHRRVVGSRKVHRCIVPRFAYVTLTVTYSAS